tara:strand:- start:48 stop:545 length:498 start_codon:yes stop_codon:yes gene_type:complete
VTVKFIIQNNNRGERLRLLPSKRGAKKMIIKDVRPIKKQCKDCGKFKLHEEFATASWKTLKSGERKHYRRKSCHKCYYVSNNKPKRNKIVTWYKEVKMSLSCESCGYDRVPQAIEFHHVKPSTKVGNVSDMVYDMNSIKTILKEIKKCVALCVLCHAEETHQQGA